MNQSLFNSYLIDRKDHSINQKEHSIDRLERALDQSKGTFDQSKVVKQDFLQNFLVTVLNVWRGIKLCERFYEVFWLSICAFFRTYVKLLETYVMYIG